MTVSVFKVEKGANDNSGYAEIHPEIRRIFFKDTVRQSADFPPHKKEVGWQQGRTDGTHLPLAGLLNSLISRVCMKAWSIYHRATRKSRKRRATRRSWR